MAWQDKIPGCFGDQDHKFANHPLDAEQAIRLLLAIKEARVSYKDVVDAIKTYLAGKGCDKKHVSDQIARVKRRYGAWF